MYMLIGQKTTNHTFPHYTKVSNWKILAFNNSMHELEMLKAKLMNEEVQRNTESWQLFWYSVTEYKILEVKVVG